MNTYLVRPVAEASLDVHAVHAMNVMERRDRIRSRLILLTIAAIIAIVAVASLAGCSTTEAKLTIVQHEIATLGSEAKTSGARSDIEIAAIASQVLYLQDHVREISK